MRIEIWSDIVCPWCYIGKRRLEKALDAFKASADATDDDIEIVFRSYELDPTAPAVPTKTVAEWLGEKYGGGPEAGRAMVDQVEAVAATEGLAYRHHESLRVNTIDAHRLLHLALESGGPRQQGVLKEALLSAYFIEAQNVADHDVLLRIATAAGLDEARVREVLGGDEYADAVREDIAQAAAFGANGVPFFVFERKYGISGAQPPETFLQVLRRTWDETRPPVMIGAEGDVCGPDGCTA